MSPSAEQHAEPRVPQQLWRPAGVVFVVASLAALGAGTAPELFFPVHLVGSFRVLPALPTLFAAQAGFVLAFFPLLRGPRRAGPAWRRLTLAVGEACLWVAACVPMYVAGAWLSDASGADVFRAGVYLAGLWLAAWGLSSWHAAGRSVLAVPAVLVALSGAVGLPVVSYLLAELAGATVAAGWLARAAPVLRIFTLARRGGALLPGPWWSWVLWPAVGVAAGLVRLLVPASQSPRATASRHQAYKAS